LTDIFILETLVSLCIMHHKIHLSFYHSVPFLIMKYVIT